ncbi:YbjQ family protein [Longimicrobium sp.]|uniref:YbjQ family protein n=1 Tax=Longimicrobium sp. TaxID=2029185 RepID=UPI002E34B9C6|nr:YbjQ family protein [Longimicrobium sp.]HEX6042282.1 YbjQ family protein [Longimicrobium sp.]
MNRKRLLLTTTSSLDGWTIEEYLGPVSAEVVVGTGLFTDFFSSWTDFFGMESRAHQSKLDQIKERALATIEYKGLRLGATAVIGLRVDHDEISAGGKSLLMVTAMGTAVRASRAGPGTGTHAPAGTGAISAHDLKTERDRLRLLQRAQAGQLDLGDTAIWDFVVDNQVEELAPHVLKRAVNLNNQWAYDPAQRDRAWAPLKEFFFRLTPDHGANHLYGALSGPEPEAEFAIQVIREAALLDVERVGGMLRQGDPTLSIRALQVVPADKPFYTPDDIAPLEALRALIPVALPPIPTTRKKGLMGEKEVWACPCGEQPDAKMQACGVCGRDRYGTPQRWLNPDRAVALLDERIGLLKTQFAGE